MRPMNAPLKLHLRDCGDSWGGPSKHTGIVCRCPCHGPTPTIYIAGPMTGIPEYNFPAFNHAADAWRALDWKVVNPAELDGEDTSQPWSFYLKRDLKLLVDCHAIATLPEWQSSKGAQLEVYVAEKLGLQRLDATHPVAPPPTHLFEEGHRCCHLPDYAHFDYWLGRR